MGSIQFSTSKARCSLLDFCALKPGGQQRVKMLPGLWEIQIVLPLSFSHFSGVACHIWCLYRSYQDNTKEIM